MDKNRINDMVDRKIIECFKEAFPLVPFNPILKSELRTSQKPLKEILTLM